MKYDIMNYRNVNIITHQIGLRRNMTLSHPLLNFLVPNVILLLILASLHLIVLLLVSEQQRPLKPPGIELP